MASVILHSDLPKYLNPLRRLSKKSTREPKEELRFLELNGTCEKKWKTASKDGDDGVTCEQDGRRMSSKYHFLPCSASHFS